ncbi:hypothetical protein [Crocosphaera sp. XPORK-15E]|uniref:hypothetical protein n=1 Tax=Crocosphaera sp. XPORK-15E TaxID=3110247 RepID=UPI002B214CAB|nr:hypothetical protein [Crocosphaera sp. XPORK-15E]MEA5536698.1 hypothetical protein [Crocosphaera sp. XPORK-15E]
MVQVKTATGNNRVRWCSPFLNNTKNPPKLEANMWVSLFNPLTDFCYDEAILLCQNSETEWVIWIPDHGEAKITIEEFCLMA